MDATLDLTALVVTPDYKAEPEGILPLHIVAFDWNCPQHIALRFIEREFARGCATAARSIDCDRGLERYAAERAHRQGR